MTTPNRTGIAVTAPRPGQPLYDILPTPVLRFGPDLALTYANAAGQAIRGDLGVARSAARAALHTGHAQSAETAGYHVSVAPDGDGALVIYSPNPPAAAPAGDAAAMFTAFLGAVPAIAWLKDEQGRYVYINPAHQRILGSTAAQWLGKTDAELLPAEVADKFAQNDRTALEHETPFETTESVRDHAGQITQFHSVKFPVPLPTGTGIGGFALDGAHRNDFDEARRKAEAQILQAQKLESLGVLAGGIAHDFNNLLTGVLGFASLAQMAVPEGGDLANWLGQIEKAAQRAADLCKQMLAYAGRGVFVVAVTDLNKLVGEMSQLLSTAISKSAVLRYNLSKGLPAIRCDATQVRQVVMNLITNASDAIDDRSGLITLTTGVIDADSKYLHEISAEYLPAGRYVYVEVSDTGGGMSDETKSRIFEPFFSTKFAGRGLGLSAVQGIVRAHRGAIKVYTALGKGTTFKMLLPANDGQEAMPIMAAPGPRKFGGGRLALVIDDEEDIRVYARKTLELAGFTVEVAADGRAGVAAFAARPAEFAVVLLDLTMPRLGGSDTYRELRHARSEVVVLLMSGFAAEEATAGFEGKGLAGFLRKPFRATELLQILHEAVGPK